MLAKLLKCISYHFLLYGLSYHNVLKRMSCCQYHNSIFFPFFCCFFSFGLNQTSTHLQCFHLVIFFYVPLLSLQFPITSLTSQLYTLSVWSRFGMLSDYIIFIVMQCFYCHFFYIFLENSVNFSFRQSKFYPFLDR